MAMRSTQPVTEMNTRNLPGGKGRPARKADNLTDICVPTVYTLILVRLFYCILNLSEWLFSKRLSRQNLCVQAKVCFPEKLN
jgi:hypothetical protein